MSVAQIQLWSRPVGAGSYSGALITAALVVPLVAGALASRRGLPLGRVAICLSVATISMLVGSRLLHWWTHPSSQAAEAARLMSLDFRDFSLYGGLLLAGLASVLCCRLTRVNVWELADCAAVALSIGLVIVRLGCFVNGCCFGVETDLPWGVIYPRGSQAQLHQIAGDLMAMFHGSRAVHPTQIYEMLAAVVAGLLAFVLLHRNFVSGVPFLAAAIFFTSIRWIIDPLRVHNPTLGTTGWTYRHLYEMLVAIGTVVLVWRLHAERKSRRGGRNGERYLAVARTI